MCLQSPGSRSSNGQLAVAKLNLRFQLPTCASNGQCEFCWQTAESMWMDCGSGGLAIWVALTWGWCDIWSGSKELKRAANLNWCKVIPVHVGSHHFISRIYCILYDFCELRLQMLLPTVRPKCCTFEQPCVDRNLFLRCALVLILGLLGWELFYDGSRDQAAHFWASLPKLWSNAAELRKWNWTLMQILIPASEILSYSLAIWMCGLHRRHFTDILQNIYLYIC